MYTDPNEFKAALYLWHFNITNRVASYYPPEPVITDEEMYDEDSLNRIIADILAQIVSITGNRCLPLLKCQVLYENNNRD